MFDYDYSFCSDKDCPYKDCMRHESRMPVGVPVSVSDLGYYRDKEDGLCDYYEQAEDAVVKLNLNTATKEELRALDCLGIGKVCGILGYRENHGGFHDVTELRKCRGIGERTYQKLLRLVYVEEQKPVDPYEEQRHEWEKLIPEATMVIQKFLNQTFGRLWCKLRFEHVDAAAYWFTFELVNDDRRQTWCVRHSDLEG